VRFLEERWRGEERRRTRRRFKVIKQRVEEFLCALKPPAMLVEGFATHFA
jgi:hypothetical protein